MFAWLARQGGVSAAEMLRVFNCGIGMAVVVSDAAAATALLRAQGETVFAIGEVVARLDAGQVLIDLPDNWLAG